MNSNDVFFFFLIYLFNLFIFVCTGCLLLCAWAFSSCGEGGYSSLQCAGFSLQWLLLLQSMGSRVQAQELWCTGLVAPRHVGSSRTRARTRVPCIGRWILNHCATKEAPAMMSFVSTNPVLPVKKPKPQHHSLIQHVLVGPLLCALF